MTNSDPENQNKHVWSHAEATVRAQARDPSSSSERYNVASSGTLAAAIAGSASENWILTLRSHRFQG